MARKPQYAPIIHAAEESPAELLADGVVDLKTAAQMCGHCRRWIEEQVKTCVIPSFMVDGKRVIPRRGLIRFLAERMKAAG